MSKLMLFYLKIPEFSSGNVKHQLCSVWYIWSSRADLLGITYSWEGKNTLLHLHHISPYFTSQFVTSPCHHLTLHHLYLTSPYFTSTIYHPNLYPFTHKPPYCIMIECPEYNYSYSKFTKKACMYCQDSIAGNITKLIHSVIADIG